MVDDDLTIREIFRKFFLMINNNSIEYLEADDGSKALELFKSYNKNMKKRVQKQEEKQN